MPGMTTSEKNQVEGRAGAQQLQRTRAAVGDHGFLARQAESAGKGCQRVGIVVDDEELTHWELWDAWE